MITILLANGESSDPSDAVLAVLIMIVVILVATLAVWMLRNFTEVGGPKPHDSDWGDIPHDQAGL